MSGSCTALFILVLYDYYRNCQVSGIDGLCFYGDYYIFGTFDFNSKVWNGHTSAYWLAQADVALTANLTLVLFSTTPARFLHAAQQKLAHNAQAAYAIT